MAEERKVVRFESQFSDHRIVVDAEAGKVIRFVNHAYETSDPEEIAYLGQLLGSEVRIVTEETPQ